MSLLVSYIDVYSYDEDDMVLDPKLPEHLAHFGIDIMSMKKTDKTMVELEIDANNKVCMHYVVFYFIILCVYSCVALCVQRNNLKRPLL